MRKLFLLKSIIIILLSINIYAKDIVTIGTISLNAQYKFLEFEPLAKYIEDKLTDIKINIEIPKNVDTAVKLINDKKLDIFIDSLFPSIMIKKETNMEMILNRWKGGYKSYKSVIFVNKNSQIHTLEDLKGKSIAFEDEFSTSGFYIPKKALERHLLKISNNSNKDSIRYSFARSEENCAVWVLYNKVDAASTDNLSFNTFDQSLFKIIFTSEKIPRHIVSFSKTLKTNLKNKILNILSTMHKDVRGKEILKRFSNTKKFTFLKNEEFQIIRKF